MTHFGVVWALLLLSAPQPAPPQAVPQQAQRPGLIVGQVVDGGSGRPVSGAIVSIAGPSSQGGPPPRILTGGDGRFVFRDVRRGSYSINATKPGFAEGAYGRTRAGGAAAPLSLGDGERIGDAVVRVWKHAAISGTITDETGERQVGVQVRAYRRAALGGRRRYLPSSAATTDDRGIYRISSLLPGDYIVGTVSKVTAVPLSMLRDPQGPGVGSTAIEGELVTSGGLILPPSSILQRGDSGLVVGRGTPLPPPPTAETLAIYPSTFHPYAAAGDAASVITVRPGEEHLTADLRISPVATVTVSGVAVGPDGPLTRTLVRLVPAHTTELILEADAPSAMTDLSGSFTFPAVPSGSYSVRLTRGGAPSRATGASSSYVWLDEPLNVGSENITGLALVASPGLRLSGRLEFEGDASRPRGQLSNIQIIIEPVEISPGTPVIPMTAPVSASGEFTSRDLPGGNYYVRVANSPAGWMFKSATVDGRDAADVPLNLARTTSEAVVTFTDRWSGVRGTVQNARGRDPAAVVVVFPTDQETWGSSGLNPRRVRSTRSDRLGDYSFNLPAGDYYLVAISDETSSDWQDPAFLETASRAAVRVRIGEGERRVQDLRTREVK